MSSQPTSSQSIEPIEGELSMQDLEQIAGGVSDFPLFQGDVQVVATTDSSYSSFLGAGGTSNLQAGQIMNLNHMFP